MSVLVFRYRCAQLGKDFKRCPQVTSVAFSDNDAASKLFKCSKCGAINVAKYPTLIIGQAELIQEKDNE